MFASRHTSKIDRPPSACLKIRILSSTLYFLPSFVWFLSTQTISSLDSKRRSQVNHPPCFLYPPTDHISINDSAIVNFKPAHKSLSIVCHLPLKPKRFSLCSEVFPRISENK